MPLSISITAKAWTTVLYLSPDPTLDDNLRKRKNCVPCFAFQQYTQAYFLCQANELGYKNCLKEFMYSQRIKLIIPTILPYKSMMTIAVDVNS